MTNLHGLKFLSSRYLLVVLSALALLLESQSARGHERIDTTYYFTASQLPDGTAFLPAPPDSGSPQYSYDLAQHLWGKSQRQGARAQQAIDEAAVDIREMARQFSPAFGLAITPQHTPEIYRLVLNSVLTLRLAATKVKEHYMRLRPYVQLHENTLIPEDEQSERTQGSYPSGHTIRGWGMALVLSEVNSAAQDSLLSLGYEWGQSRIIAGYHWQSDVDAGRLLASACFARLHTSKAYLKQLRKAQREFKRLYQRP